MTKLPEKLKISSSLKNLNEPDRLKIEFFASLHTHFQKLRADYFVVGASARDLVMEYVFGFKSPRATLDTDIGICVKDWQQFFTAKQYLINNLQFNEVPGCAHRLKTNGYGSLDIVPFGGVENSDRDIIWPPDNSTIMSLIGFKEAFENSVLIELASNMFVRVASLAGLVLLKLHALFGRPYLSKDVSDILFIILNYIDAGNAERFYDEHADLIIDDFDYEIASARLLGRDVGALINKEHRNELLQRIDEGFQSSTNGAFISAVNESYFRYEDNYEQSMRLIDSFRNGIADIGVVVV